MNGIISASCTEHPAKRKGRGGATKSWPSTPIVLQAFWMWSKNGSNRFWVSLNIQLGVVLDVPQSRSFPSSMRQTDGHQRPHHHQDVRIQVRLLDDWPSGAWRRYKGMYTQSMCCWVFYLCKGVYIFMHACFWLFRWLVGLWDWLLKTTEQILTKLG